MSYEYRKMSPEERNEVVDTRKNQGYPLHALPHPYRDIGWYLITGTNFEHKPIMHLPTRRATFQEQLLTTFQEIGAKVDGWVILSNHYHLLSGEIGLPIISSALKLLHGRTSRAWNLEDNLTGKRRVWYKFTDRAIRNEAHYFQALNYIHYNPIKHGYVSDPYIWKWSSLHEYFEIQGRDWLRHIWHQYPSKNFGNGWDD